MKKFLSVILTLLLIFSLTACNKEPNSADLNESGISQGANGEAAASGENEADKADENVSSGAAHPNSADNKNQATQGGSSKGTAGTSGNGTATNNKNQAGQSGSSGSSGASSNKSEVKIEKTFEKIDNGVLENASAEEMEVPENIKLIGSDDATEENNDKNMQAVAALYQLDGGVVNWTTENDLIYIITSGNNRLAVIDSKTMMPIANISLAGEPAEINLIGNEIYISMPDLCRIDVFAKSSLAKITTLDFEHQVSSFCIDGNYIYYSEHDQHCDVYRRNMRTNELTKILPDRGWTFYQPKLYLNGQDNILYIGETGCSGCALFYYDATTLELKSVFREDNYGVFNHTRDIFHVGNEIFWANHRLSDTSGEQIIGKYGIVAYGSVNYASEEIVATFEGIFRTDTYECFVNYFDAGFDFDYLLITKSNNIFFRKDGSNEKVIVGVNFAVQ